MRPRPDRRITVMTYREATLLIKWLENKINYCLLWNSSKLSSERKAETPKNQSRRSNMLSHPRKLLSSSMDGAGKIFYHPARSTQQHIKPARTVGAVRDADRASGFAACRRSDCDRNADCRQNVLRARQHRCSAGRATARCLSERRPSDGFGFRLPRSTHYDRDTKLSTPRAISQDKWNQHWKICNIRPALPPPPPPTCWPGRKFSRAIANPAACAA